MRALRTAPLVLLLAVACSQGSPVTGPTLTSTPTPSASATASPSPSAPPTTRPPSVTHPPRTASPTPPATRSPRPQVTRTTEPPATRPPTLPPGSSSLFVLGDSVLISAEPAVRAALDGWRVTYDAVGSRRLPQGIDVLRTRRSEIGRVVVIQMGNNYIASEGFFASQIDEAMRVLRGTSRVVWLTVAERWPSRVTINQAIRAASGRWPTIVVGDWARMVAAHPEYAGDMLHLSPAGRTAIARLIDGCVGPAA